ncbi:MAG: flippase [Lachnospiraceae bacterium]|nr:flippase [Lachnospiraceae bacterium]
MKKQHSVTFNFIMNFILTASSVIFPLITFPYISRILLPVGTGKVASATAVVNYFSMISMLGIPTYGIRACAQVRDDKEKLSKVVQEILIINVVMMLIVYIVFGVSLQIVPEFAEDRTLLLVMSTAILLNVIGVSWLYSALEEYAYITMASLMFKVLAVILMFVLVHDKEDYIIYGGLTVISNIGSYVFNFLRLRKHIFIKFMGHYDLKRHIKPIAVFCAMTVATSIYTNLDTVMLKFISGDVQTGYYSAAVNIKTALTGLVISLGTVLLPRLSYYIEKGMQEEFKKITSNALSFVVMMALPLTVYFILFAPEGIGLLSGSAYAPAVWPMRFIMPTILFIGLSNILGMQILVPTDREKKVLQSVIVGAAVDFMLNLLLIPVLGASGASIGTLVAEFAVVLVQAVILKDFLRKIYQKYRMVPYVLAVFPGAAAAIALREFVLADAGNFLTLVVTSIAFFGVYEAVLLLLKEKITLEFVLPYLKKIIFSLLKIKSE